jgi:excisionase family DNA binding protein
MTGRSLAEYGELLTMDEVCLVLQLSRNTVYELARSGDVPTIRFGRQLRTPRAALEQMMGGSTECDSANA